MLWAIRHERHRKIIVLICVIRGENTKGINRFLNYKFKFANETEKRNLSGTSQAEPGMPKQ